jgi:hypothetical protein
MNEIVDEAPLIPIDIEKNAGRYEFTLFIDLDLLLLII